MAHKTQPDTFFVVLEKALKYIENISIVSNITYDFIRHRLQSFDNMSSSETLIPTDDEQEIARNSSRLLISGSMELHMRSAAEREVVVRVPERIAHVFQHIFLQLAQGKGVTIIPNEALLTTQDAADFLHVSRPFLIRLLTKHNVRIQKVGNRRKVSFEEVKKLQETLKAQSRDALNELEQLDRELGLE